MVLGPLGSLLGGPGSLLGCSWVTLGSLFGDPWASWIALGGFGGRKKVVVNGSWPLQEEFQDRFQLFGGTKGSQKDAQEGAKTSSKVIQAQKYDFFIFVRNNFGVFLGAGVFLEGKKGSKMGSEV